MGSRHPWEITLREFVEKVRRYYGIEVDTKALERIHIFRRGDRAFLLPGLDSDVILDPDLIRALCRMFNLPPLDFALDPDPDDN
jgi:hypothetical protein